MLLLLLGLQGQLQQRPVHGEPEQKEMAEALPDRLRREMLDMIDKAWGAGLGAWWL